MEKDTKGLSYVIMDKIKIMKHKMTLKNRAVNKIIECIDSSTTVEHLAACKRMMDFIYHYHVKQQTLTYLGLKYRSRLIKISGE